VGGQPGTADVVLALAAEPILVLATIAHGLNPAPITILDIVAAIAIPLTALGAIALALALTALALTALTAAATPAACATAAIPIALALAAVALNLALPAAAALLAPLACPHAL
jgi:hypothetical protein